MRDERLGTLDDPGEITDAQLVGLQQSRGDGEPRRICECAGQARCTDGSFWLDRRVRRHSATGRSRQSRSQRSSDTTTF